MDKQISHQDPYAFFDEARYRREQTDNGFEGFDPDFSKSLAKRILWLTAQRDHYDEKLKEALALREARGRRLAQRGVQESLDRRDSGITESEWLGNE